MLDAIIPSMVSRGRDGSQSWGRYRVIAVYNSSLQCYQAALINMCKRFTCGGKLQIQPIDAADHKNDFRMPALMPVDSCEEAPPGNHRFEITFQKFTGQ